jgi:transposase-like protein
MAMSSILNAPHFQCPEKARKFLEKLRWNGEPVCPHCGTVGNAYATQKAGVYRCGSKECRKDFSVTTKSVMEASHIKLHVWLQAFHYLASSKKGISAHQLHRTLKITYKTAWFLAHRIREAMRTGGLIPMGGAGGIVEIDETVIGRQEGETPKHRKGGWQFRNVVMTLVTRGGSARSFHIDGTTHATILPIIRANIQRQSVVMTDEASWYKTLDTMFAGHEAVNHSIEEWVRGRAHTNTVEGYYSIFKRGMKGVYQHCKEKHLHRYLSEFDFRYSHRVALGYSDEMRAAIAIKGAAGKRLTYRQPRIHSLSV